MGVLIQKSLGQGSTVINSSFENLISVRLCIDVSLQTQRGLEIPICKLMWESISSIKWV